MPSLSKITANFFVSLINRLGVRPPPSESFLLSNVVQPVSLVDADISIPVTATPPVFGTPFSIGVAAAPAANTVLADTTGLAVGSWAFYVTFSIFETANCRVEIQHRDAANAANIWSQSIFGVAATSEHMIQLAFAKTIAAGERLRVQTLNAPGGTSQYHVNIFAKQLV